MLNTIHGEVCGHEFERVNPIIKHDRDRKKASTRIYVHGFTRANGENIRFKSLAKAERHIRNMGMVR